MQIYEIRMSSIPIYISLKKWDGRFLAEKIKIPSKDPGFEPYAK